MGYSYNTKIGSTKLLCSIQNSIINTHRQQTCTQCRKFTLLYQELMMYRRGDILHKMTDILIKENETTVNGWIKANNTGKFKFNVREINSGEVTANWISRYIPATTDQGWDKDYLGNKTLNTEILAIQAKSILELTFHEITEMDQIFQETNGQRELNANIPTWKEYGNYEQIIEVLAAVTQENFTPSNTPIFE